jgi:hypothetical protein
MLAIGKRKQPRRRFDMSQLMDRAFKEAMQLPEPDQEAIASIILQEIESERRWDRLFARPESAALLSRLADEALAGMQAGRAVKLDIDKL